MGGGKGPHSPPPPKGQGLLPDPEGKGAGGGPRPAGVGATPASLSTPWQPRSPRPDTVTGTGGLVGPVAGGPPSLCWALAPAPGLRVRPRDDPRQQRGRGCRGRESRVGGRPASARRPSSCLLLQADVRGHWDGRALTLPAPRGPGAHTARHCTDSPPLVTEANSGFLRDAWPVPPRSTRSRSSRVHSREPGRPRVRPHPSAPRQHAV